MSTDQKNERTELVALIEDALRGYVEDWQLTEAAESVADELEGSA